MLGKVTGLVGIVLTALWASSGIALASPGWTEPAETGPVTWYLLSVDGPRRITYSVESGYCVGKPKPRLLKPEVDWRPHAVIVTVRLHTPEVRFGRNEACAGVGLGISGHLHLARSIAGRAVYDGSTSPPTRMAGPQAVLVARLAGAFRAWFALEDVVGISLS